MTARNSSRPIARVFRAIAAPGCRERNCSKDFTPRLRLWSTVRWGALNIEFSSQLTHRRPKLCSSPSGGTSTRSRWRLATRGSNHICQRVIPHL